MSRDDDEDDAGAVPELTVLSPRRTSRLRRFDLASQLHALQASLDPSQPLEWPQRGVRTAFPLLSDALDGFRNLLYVIAGGARMGKSILLLQLVYDLLRFDPTARAVFVSLTQPARELNLRLVAMAGRCHLDYLSRPTPEGEEKYEKKKQAGLRRAGELRERLRIVDESLGAVDLDEVSAMVRELRDEGPGPIFLAIDPLFKLRSRELAYSAPLDDRVGYLAHELKSLALQEAVGLLVTTRLDTGSGAVRPTLMDLDGQSNLVYEADFLGLAYCDAVNHADTPLSEWEWGTDDLMVPIYELLVAKNRMGSFAGRLFYRFYQSFSSFKECSNLEVDNYNRMLQNLRVHKEGEEDAKELGLPVVEDVSAT